MKIINEHNENELYVQAAADIVEKMRAEHCTLGIVGGRSIPGLFEKLLAYAHEMKGRIDVFWLDERIGSEKNYIPALPYLEKLHKIGVDIHWYPLQATSKETMHVEARQVLQELAAATGKPEFDIIICSAGEDGHVASLFPGHASLQHKNLTYIIEEHAPKPPPLRVTVTPPLLLTARHAFLFFVGEKRAAYELFMNEQVSVEQCPAKLLLQVPLTVFTCLK